ncbi:MAG: DUF4252 domain-containing protein [Bacteroidales bacterium]
MKTRITLIAICLVLSTNLFAQPASFEKVFNAYAGKKGLVTLNISGSLLNFLFNSDETNSDCTISSVKILTVEDSILNEKINFYKEVVPNLDKSEYEELMTVKSAGQDFVMFCKKEKKRITEFILVSGGDDNALIYLKGNLSLDDAKKISYDLAHTDKLRELEYESND